MRLKLLSIAIVVILAGWCTGCAMSKEGGPSVDALKSISSPVEPVAYAGKPMLPAKPQRITVSLVAPFAVQENLHGEEALAFMKKFWSQALEPILSNRPDLIVLPEACDRFPRHTMEERFRWYEYRGDQMRDFFRDIARANHCYIAYSAARRMPDGSYRNSTQLIGRDGEIVGIYNKNHLVPAETTEGKILCGKDAPVFETDFGRVAMAICFDLNFDELLRKYAAQRPNLIIFSSMYHGGLMQNYWAYQCRSYFVGAFAYESTVVNPVGTTIARSTNYYQTVTTTINLDYQVVHLDENWEKLVALKKKYGPGVTVFDPGFVGAVLVTSELPDVSARQMIEEFQMETWDEYYERSMRHRHTPGNMEP